MADVAQRKQERDFSAECDVVIPEAEKLANEGQLEGALDKLLVFEKQTRNASDAPSTSKVLKAIVSACWQARKLTLLNETISSLSKKHGQLRQSVVDMVELAMTWLSEMDPAERLTLIHTLREITDGKIYLEVQRARVTRTLAEITEKTDVKAASDLLYDLQVETFGSMDRREKVDFILEQMRLLRQVQDWDKLLITSRKVSTKYLNDEVNHDLKLRFHLLVIQYCLHKAQYLEVCKHYRSIYETASVQADEHQWSAALRNAVFFVILAPYDNEQSDLLGRISKEDNLNKMAELASLVKCFTTPELMRWPGIQELYGQQLRQTKVFGSKGVQGVLNDIDEEDALFKGDERWKQLHLRVVEHNVRIIAKYYTQITLQRLSELLDMSAKETEEVLTRLAVEKMVYAKINRPAGVVSFVAPKSPEQTLNDWSSDVSKLMGLIEKTSHLISKEYAVANAQAGLKAIKT